VQTERKAHEEWAKLALKSQRAAALMHYFVANMGHQNAVVISQKTLAKLMRCSVDTVQRAIVELVADHWVQVVKLNGPGTVSAYVVNSAIAWGETREHIGRLSVFHAAVVADADDQPDQDAVDQPPELRRIPVLYPGERQLPTGEGLPPPSQPALPGLEPDLPAKRHLESER
jgi:DNA-binding transcriptional MocR family regulator